MKAINKILLVVLIILSMATGLTKVFQMHEEMELFRAIGFPDVLTIVFGVIQVIGGILLIIKKFRVQGATIMFFTFIIATIVVFFKGMIAFGVFSILFIILAYYQRKLSLNLVNEK